MNRIKQLREEKGLLQSDIGAFLGITGNAVGFYENEKRDIPTEILKKLSDYFNVSIDYILGKTDVRDIIDPDKIRIGLSTKDYTEITDTQKKQIEDFARFVLKDNEKKNKDNN